jgi:hypothetical protein
MHVDVEVTLHETERLVATAAVGLIAVEGAEGISGQPTLPQPEPTPNTRLVEGRSGDDDEDDLLAGFDEFRKTSGNAETQAGKLSISLDSSVDPTLEKIASHIDGAQILVVSTDANEGGGRDLTGQSVYTLGLITVSSWLGREFIAGVLGDLKGIPRRKGEELSRWVRKTLSAGVRERFEHEFLSGSKESEPEAVASWKHSLHMLRTSSAEAQPDEVELAMRTGEDVSREVLVELGFSATAASELAGFMRTEITQRIATRR